MHLEKQFDLRCSPEAAAGAVADDEALLGLLPDSEIVERDGNLRTLRSRYRALGQEGTATFHFVFGADGGVEFEKVCDGRVWRALTGSVRFEKRGAGTRVRIVMEGRTKPLVPEFTIRGPLRDQLERMARALREHIEQSIA
jgi:hypothetical protein